FLSTLTSVGVTTAKWAAGIGAAITGALTASTAAFIKLGSQLQDMSAKTGVSAEILGELKYAAEQSGASLDDVERAIFRMNRTIADAADGTQSAVDALAKLGLTAHDLIGKSADKQMQMIADSLAAIEDPTLRSAAAMEVFGRGATALLPLLNEGAAGMQALQDRARELGIVLSGEDVAAAEALGDSFDDLWLSIHAVAVQTGAALAPALDEALKIVQEHVTAGVEWVKGNRELIGQFVDGMIPA